MSYAKQTIPTPKTATQDLANELQTKYVKFFKKVFTKAQLITESKHCYSIVINATNANGHKLEQLLGTDNAKIVTSEILFELLTGSKHIE